MSLFRRREPLHVRLARAGAEPVAPEAPRGPWDAAGIHGLPRLREWDIVTTVEDPAVAGERAELVCVEPGRVVVEDGEPSAARLAAPLEASLSPPFRAEAVRRDGSLWALAARRIELVDLPDAPGEEIELSSHLGHRTLLLDGERSFGTIASLERPEHVVRARRVEGTLWEVEIDPL